jgi:hypothetical protein
MLNRLLCRVVGLSALGGFALAAPPAHAEQVVAAEAAYTHSAQTTKDSHYRVKPTPETPANWASPVDYAHGSVHVRLEVKTKPSATPTRYQICFEMKVNYCCTDQAPAYTAPGVYEWDTDVEKLWRPGPVDFAQGILQNALILKDTNNVKPAPENVGEATSALYMPSDVAVTVTLVSSGSTFQPPNPPDPSQGGGGGTGPSGASQGGGAPGGSAGTSGNATGTGGGAGSNATGTGESGGNAGSQPVVQALAGGGMAAVASSSGGGGTAPNSAAPAITGNEISCRSVAPGRGSAPAAALAAIAIAASAFAARRRR